MTARFWTAPVLWRFSISSVGTKAAVDCRSPRRYRDGAPTSAVHGPNACGKNERGLSVSRPNDRQVLDCASPLALFDLVRGHKSGRGLPQSKTLSRRRTSSAVHTVLSFVI